MEIEEISSLIPSAIIIKLDENENLEWAKLVEGITIDMVDTSETGDVIVSGQYEGTIKVEETEFTSSGETDVIIINYSKDGTMKWAKSIGWRK